MINEHHNIITEKWALVYDNDIREILNSDPEGRFHPSIHIEKIPSYLHNYIDTSYKFENGMFKAPSGEYVLNQVKIKIAQYFSQLRAQTNKYNDINISEIDRLELMHFINAGIRYESNNSIKFWVNFKFSGHKDMVLLSVEDMIDIYDGIVFNIIKINNLYNETLKEIEQFEFENFEDLIHFATMKMQEIDNNMKKGSSHVP